MPEWLLKDEEYIPQSDRDTFINKSILSLLSMISRIRAQSAYTEDRLYVNAAFKVAFTIILVILISISNNFTFVIVINVYLLAILCFLQAQEILRILKVSFVMALFTFAVLVPAAFRGNAYSCIMITSKVFATIMSVNILSHTTKWSSITNSLKRFLVPDLFIFVLDITIKYITMLGDLMLNMLYSLKLRSVGRNKSKYNSLSGIAGTMFIKSREMAEEMYSAMECRGFTGEYHAGNTFKFTLADFIYIMINVGLIFAFVYSGRV